MSAPIELPPPPPLRPRGVGDILDTAFRLYARHWRTLIPIVALVVVPLTIVQYGLEQALLGRIEVVERGGRIVEIHATADELQRAALGGFLLVGISILITLILVGAVAWATAGALVGREPTVGGSYRYGMARMWPILLVAVLTGLAVLGGLILFVIPGIIFMVRFSVAVPALVVENARGRAALSRSWDLVRDRSWPVLGTLVVAGLLTGIVSAVVTAPFPDAWFPRGLAAALASALTTPFTALVIGLIYFDLRVRKEHLDVDGLARELDAAAP
jgi:hypothetical protein